MSGGLRGRRLRTGCGGDVGGIWLRTVTAALKSLFGSRGEGPVV